MRKFTGFFCLMCVAASFTVTQRAAIAGDSWSSSIIAPIARDQEIGEQKGV